MRGGGARIAVEVFHRAYALVERRSLCTYGDALLQSSCVMFYWSSLYCAISSLTCQIYCYIGSLMLANTLVHLSYEHVMKRGQACIVILVVLLYIEITSISTDRMQISCRFLAEMPNCSDHMETIADFICAAHTSGNMCCTYKLQVGALK